MKHGFEAAEKKMSLIPLTMGLFFGVLIVTEPFSVSMPLPRVMTRARVERKGVIREVKRGTWEKVVPIPFTA